MSVPSGDSPSGEREQGFKVTDRRAAAGGGDDAEAKSSAEPQSPSAELEAAGSDDTGSDDTGSDDTGSDDAGSGDAGSGADYGDIPAPPADFNTLVLSLSTSALMHLGMLAGPDGEAAPKNLPLARHSIDLLSMLEQKTKGNLSGEEETLLGQVLYDLRMHFVTVSKS